ncbi:MAG: xylulokinase [Cellvibrionales bacterium TMED49]|nr:xylulokinase [Porticoccaceae bacterium]OUU38016.1 MAG: xylulokinase [Cellvibrionales bacterium TMED49]
MKTVLGIDLGTQSIKLVFYDFEIKKVVASSSADLEVYRDDSGTAEQNVDDWLSALESCFSNVPEPIKSSLVAIGVSGQQHGFVALDAHDKPLYPVKLWCDTATQAEVDEITDNFGGRARLIEVAGNPILTGYTAPKIVWLKKNRPSAYERLAHIMLPHDYLNFVLTGEKVMECGDASGTGMLNVHEREWSAEVLYAMDSGRDLSACLPKLVVPDQFIGATTSRAAKDYGIPRGVPVSCGGGDNMMGAIGTGNVVPGVLTMSLGTSGCLYAYSDTPIVDPKGNIAAFCSSTGGWLPLVCTMNCTLSTELIRAPLGVGLREFENVVSAAKPGCDGVISLPFFSGERTPDLPNARGSILGLTAENCNTSNLLRAQVESSIYALKFGLDEMISIGVKGDEIILTGGGSNSAVWRQIASDICQLEVAVLDQGEGAAFGAALQSLWVFSRASGQDLSIADITTEHLTKDLSFHSKPNESFRKIYDESYLRYKKAIHHISPFYSDI